MTIRRSLAVLALVFSGLVSAQQPMSPGEVWRSEDESHKIMYVYGFVAGHKSGAERQQWVEIKAECGNVEEGWTGERLKEYLDCTGKSRPTRSHMRAQDAQLLVDGLDAIYSDIANSRIDIPFALSIMQDRLLGRIDDEQFQRVILSARSTSVQNN